MKKTITFMKIPIDVVLDPGFDTGHEYGSAVTSWDVDKGEFSLAFRYVEIRHIAHECWHLFMRIMQWMEHDNCFAFSELATELYAWNFGNLVDEVFKAVVEMGEELDDKRRKNKETEGLS